ncbi:hypothetical protein [Acetobacter sp. DsW_063]|uniref:hypothetical protein n=1 Tax=Acetobacter sp. DsW_063 TaxID=1514894 RepID=UPI0011781CBB|nr:hypothetical protein [Acetobacter sp. DsW_063]
MLLVCSVIADAVLFSETIPSSPVGGTVRLLYYRQTTPLTRHMAGSDIAFAGHDSARHYGVDILASTSTISTGVMMFCHA